MNSKAVWTSQRLQLTVTFLQSARSGKYCSAGGNILITDRATGRNVGEVSDQVTGPARPSVRQVYSLFLGITVSCTFELQNPQQSLSLSLVTA
jgi:hypothetical protein